MDFSPGIPYTGDIPKERGALHEFRKPSVSGAQEMRPHPGGGGGEAGGEPADRIEVGNR